MRQMIVSSLLMLFALATYSEETPSLVIAPDGSFAPQGGEFHVAFHLAGNGSHRATPTGPAARIPRWPGQLSLGE